MKKINKPTSKQKNTPMVNSVGAMLPPIQPQGASPIVWPVNKSSWAQMISTKKPVRCGDCGKDMKPLHTALFWDASKKYLSIAFLGFNDVLLGIKLVEFFTKPRNPICITCIIEK